MGKFEKLVDRFLSIPKDFTFTELNSLLAHIGYKETRSGRTSGSRVRFINANGDVVHVHKPHPSEIVKPPYIREIRDLLVQRKEI
jgi:predicted RNA binding protein YcfA (HicA-like mRNA interferase family)